MNSKQIVGVLGLIVLLVILIYPAFATGSVSVIIRSSSFQNADHVYVTINSVWAHRAGQSSPAGWELILNVSKTVDLTQLASSSAILGGGSIPAANYDMVRLNVGNVTWAYNKTTTPLQVESTDLPSNVEFSVVSGKTSTITLVLTGSQEVLQGSKFFVSQLNATATSQS